MIRDVHGVKLKSFFQHNLVLLKWEINSQSNPTNMGWVGWVGLGKW